MDLTLSTRFWDFKPIRTGDVSHFYHQKWRLFTLSIRFLCTQNSRPVQRRARPAKKPVADRVASPEHGGHCRGAGQSHRSLRCRGEAWPHHFALGLFLLKKRVELKVWEHFVVVEKNYLKKKGTKRNYIFLFKIMPVDGKSWFNAPIIYIMSGSSLISLPKTGLNLDWVLQLNNDCVMWAIIWRYLKY